jgi:predicted aldo/keto reductase-like oxidoreductase
MLGATAAAAAAPPPAAPRLGPEHYVTLGRTGVRVSPVAAGLALKADPLVASADAGINYFDTAEKYLNGRHNQLLAEALKGRDRKSIFVSAKFQDGLQNELTATSEQIVDRVHKCLERLGTEYIDGMLIHNVQRVEALDNPAWLAAYERLKADGKVRFLGASTHDPKLTEIVARIVASGRYDLMLLAYNPTTEGNLYGSAGWPQIPKLLEEAAAKGIGVATMKIMIGAVAAGVAKGVGPDGIDPNDIVARGKYLDARIAATRWVLSNRSVRVVQYTMTGPETVAAAVEAVTTRFRAADAALARRYDASVRGHGCPIPCPAPCVTACPAGLAIPDVLRFRMYADQFGMLSQARLEYADLPAALDARVCLECASQACVAACPEGLPVKRLMRSSHPMLSQAPRA